MGSVVLKWKDEGRKMRGGEMMMRRERASGRARRGEVKDKGEGEPAVMRSRERGKIDLICYTEGNEEIYTVH